ncbi:hypothetical protein MA16_Dca018650 [Dendrobium catenatum]|uniref:Uncharacterized protein n=1 Tax=Dendrobium catenatum TaxID=906689 RepID=A0A2I0W5U2_9ASPA|nr:hypothetical protein MA16_Dca018650 [Dendrobium catenatum]
MRRAQSAWEEQRKGRTYKLSIMRHHRVRLNPWANSLRRDNHSLVAQFTALKSKLAGEGEIRKGEEKPQPAIGIDGACKSDSSAVLTQDVFKVEEDWEETCVTGLFTDVHGLTLAWFSADLVVDSNW